MRAIEALTQWWNFMVQLTPIIILWRIYEELKKINKKTNH